MTGDEVRIVLYNDLGVSGDLTLPWTEVDEQPAHLTDFQQSYLVRTLKAHVRYFNQRYQNYGRALRVIAVPSRSGITSTCGGRGADAAVLRRDYSPFAFTVLGDGMSCFVAEAAKLGVPTIGFLTDIDHDDYVARPGYVWSFNRDLEEQARVSAELICRKLLGGSARYSSTLASKERRFALLFPSQSQRGPYAAIQAGRLLSLLRTGCGLEPSDDGSSGLLVKTFIGSGATQALGIMADLQRLGVTTVTCYCVPAPSEVSILTFQSAATALGFFPEWYFDEVSRMYRAMWHRRYSVQEQASFGVTPEWIQGRIETSYAYRAATMTDRGLSPNLRFNHDIYHGLHLLFTAIQLAGPNLTVANLANGLTTYSVRNADPWIPEGSFGEGGNPYTFLRGALAWTWDRTGRQPGHRIPSGCLRTRGHLAIDGAWRNGDGDLDIPGICMGPHQVAGPESAVL